MLPLSIRTKGQRGIFLVLVAFSGGCLPRNEAPITFGVPDGFVVSREIVRTNRPDVRTELVQYAYHDQRLKATICWPNLDRPLPLQVNMGGTVEQAVELAHSRSIVVVVGKDEKALLAMARTLEGVDGSRISTNFSL